MDLHTFRRDALLFNPSEFGRIFAFVDFSNVRYWAKSFWPDENRGHLKREIDIDKLAQMIDMVGTVEKFFYYGHYKERPHLPPHHSQNVPYRNSIFRIDKARKAGFKIRTKDIKTIDTYDDAGRRQGQIHKCNFDVEITMDMIKQLPKYDTVFLWSGASSELKAISDPFIPADRLREQLELVPYKKALPA